jgi:drug/metabolite transporter (DMT)-like permease
MEQIIAKIGQIPGKVYLLTAIIIFAAANSVIRKLTEIGAQNLIAGRNPISFCNVLFVGNLCALIVLILIYRKQWTQDALVRLSKTDWLSLGVVAILSGALAPALTFMALDLTQVNNVVLIGRIEPPLILALSVFLLGERVNRWVVLGAILAFIGVTLTIILQQSHPVMMDRMGFQIGRGELMAAGGAISLAISTIISKIKLRQIPLGIYSVFRMAVGTIIFFIVVLIFFEPGHFMDVFSPFLWQWMFIYGAVILVGGQFCWFIGLKTTGASEVSLASSFSPIAGILAAYFILGESPTFAQYIGGIFILLGIICNQIGVWKKAAQPIVTNSKEMDMEVGFKGV